MKKFLLFTLTLTLTLSLGTVRAQDGEGRSSDAKNSVYLELLGDAILYSVNYERIFSQSNNFSIAGRAGFSYIFLGFIDESKGPAIPIELLGQLGDKHHFEFGLGATYMSLHITDVSLLGPTEEYDVTRFYMSGRVGYRFQKPEGGFVFRVGFTPLILLSETTTQQNPKDPTRFLPLGGLSLGYAF